MKIKKRIVVDITKWCTMADRAADKGCTIQNIYNQVDKGKLKSRKIEELGLTLVEK